MPDKKQKNWRPFEEAHKYARSLGLQSRCEWRKFIDRQYFWLGKKPTDIPDNPVEAYKFEWKGWENWLGSGNIPVKESKAPQKPVRKRKLKRKKSRIIEKVCPVAAPEDSLPDKPIASNSFCCFEDARKYARKLGLTSHYEWNRFVRTHLKLMPADIPHNPASIYRFEWKGWPDWLGVLDNAP